MTKTFLILSIFFGISTFSFTEAAELTAEAIIDRVTDRKGSQAEEVQVTMKIQNGNGTPREANRVFKMSALYSANNDFKTLIQFLVPAGLKNAKILTIKEGDSTGQWVYLPSAKRVSRINSDEDMEGILDSDLSYSDLKAESNEDYNYSLNSGSYQDYADKACKEPAYSVTAVPKSGRGSSYAKRVLSISKSKDTVCSLLIYNSAGKVIKNIQNQNFRNYDGLWRPSESTLATHKGDKIISKTVLNYANWKIKAKLNKNLFSVNTLDK